MELFLAILFVTMLVAPVAYNVGAWTKENPSEDEMIKRLVKMRAERRMRAATEAGLERELDDAAQILAARHP